MMPHWWTWNETIIAAGIIGWVLNQFGLLEPLLNAVARDRRRRGGLVRALHPRARRPVKAKAAGLQWLPLTIGKP